MVGTENQKPKTKNQKLITEMTETKIQTDPPPAFPDHTQLPDENSTFVKNFQEHPQGILLTLSDQFYNSDIQMEIMSSVKIVESIGEKLTPQKKVQKHQIGFIFPMYHHC